VPEQPAHPQGCAEGPDPLRGHGRRSGAPLGGPPGHPHRQPVGLL